MSIILKLRNNVVKWLEFYIWPWTQIAVLREELFKLRLERASLIEQYRDGYNAHWNIWVMNANRIWGDKLFDLGQRTLMRAFYDEGEAYRVAVDRLRIAMEVRPYDQRYFERRY